MILVALGANLGGPWGTPLETCRAALRALAAVPGLRDGRVSGAWLTAPEGEGADGPPYVNAVARFEPEASVWSATAAGDDDAPARLLRALHAIEAAAGRRRSRPNAPRTLDLDLLAMGALVRAAPDPVLPHPRLAARRFVLEPLAEVAPDWRHPASGLAAVALLARLAPAPVARLAAPLRVD